MSMMPNLANRGAECTQSSEFVIARTAHIKIACRIFYLNWKHVQDIYLKGADMMANFFTKFLANIFDFAVIFRLV